MSSYWSENPLFTTWAELSTQFLEQTLAANQAAASAMQVPSTEESETTDTLSNPPAVEQIQPAGDLPTWETNRTADERAELSVGDRFEFTKTITNDDVKQFAVASGDTNPLHLDDSYAEQTRFKGRIAHGTLVSGLISAALARMPGLVIYLSQDLEFKGPVRIGDRVTAECEVLEDFGDDQYRLKTVVRNGEEVAIDGEAVILLDEIPEDA